MRSHCLGRVGLVMAVGVASWLGQGVGVGEPPRKPAPAPALSYDAAKTRAERAANEAAYREHILGMRNRLLHENLGQWVAIAGGRAYPVNESRTVVRPALTMEEAVAAAEAEVPEARHRFVFRIGEEGDLEELLGGAEIPHILGNWFMMHMDRPDVELRGLGPDMPIHFVKGGVRTEITAKGPDSRMYLRPELGPPGGAGHAEALYVLSTGFGGYATIAAATAAAASLHLWELPGSVTISGAFQKGRCHRARAQFRFAGTDLVFVLPVAIWPDRP